MLHGAVLSGVCTDVPDSSDPSVPIVEKLSTRFLTTFLKKCDVHSRRWRESTSPPVKACIMAFVFCCRLSMTPSRYLARELSVNFRSALLGSLYRADPPQSNTKANPVPEPGSKDRNHVG